MHRRVRAVRRAECVVDVDVAQLGELPRERLVVFLFLGMKAKVLEETDLPGSQILDHLLCRIADAIVG